MHNILKPIGVYTPEELTEMREELDLGSVPGETNVQREDRASVILERREDRTQRK